jgi:hypothetical protein
MRRIINERSRNRKKSQNQPQKKAYNTIFLGGVEVEKKQSLRLESNDKLLSIIGQNLMMHMDNSNSSPSEIISETKVVTSNQSNNTNSRTIDNKTSSPIRCCFRIPICRTTNVQRNCQRCRY